MVDAEEDDDWGDFNTAAEDPAMNGHAEPAIVPNEDDDFGDFSSSIETKDARDTVAMNHTSESQTLKNGDAQPSPETDENAILQEDSKADLSEPDEGGEKTGKSEASSVSNYETAKEEEEEFGDFDGPASEPNSRSPADALEEDPLANPLGEENENKPKDEQSTPENGNNLHDGSLGNFNEPAQESAASVPENGGNTNDDSFGDFNETAQEDAAPTSAPENDDSPNNGFFGDFNETAQESVAPIPENGSSPNDDSFGCFNESTPAQESEVDQVTSAPAPTSALTEISDSSPYDDSFGDFNESAAAQESEVDQATVTPAPASSEPESGSPSDDSFGDFNESSAGQEKESEPATPAPAPALADEDDWGDNFGGFSGPSAEAQTDNNNTGSKEAEESFGNFEEPVKSNENGKSPEPAIKDENSSADFGDFRAPESSVQEVGSAPIESKPTDESFGDFNEPVAATDTEAVPVSASDKVDDDWGDFGDFSGASSGDAPSEQSKANSESAGNTTPAAEAPPQAADDDDEFGEFGDFDDGNNANASHDTSQGDHKNAKAKPQSSDFGAHFSFRSGSAPSQEEQDPMLQKAKTIFSKVFDDFKMDGVDDEQKASGGEKIVVSELLASMSSKYESKSSEALVEKFHAALDEIHEDESPPKFIVSEGETLSSNSHYSVRIDGEPGSRSISAKQPIAATPPQPLTAQPAAFSGDQRPRNEISHKTHAGTTAEIPPQDSPKPPAHGAGDQLSEKAQKLLKQIPDLSHMLQSSLRLPSKR